MAVVVAGDACTGATLEGSTSVQGSILHRSSVDLLSVVVGLPWQGGATLSELRRLPLLLQVAYLRTLVGQQEHLRVCLWYILNLVVVSHKPHAETQNAGWHL